MTSADVRRIESIIDRWHKKTKVFDIDGIPRFDRYQVSIEFRNKKGSVDLFPDRTDAEIELKLAGAAVVLTSPDLEAAKRDIAQRIARDISWWRNPT